MAGLDHDFPFSYEYPPLSPPPGVLNKILNREGLRTWFYAKYLSSQQVKYQGLEKE